MNNHFPTTKNPAVSRIKRPIP